MTARPMTEGERDKLLERLQREALWQENHYEGAPCAPLLRAAHEALLSTSAAVRGMREKGLGLIQALNTHDIGASLHGQAYTDVVGAKNLLANAIAALSGIEPGEDEQARPSGSALASTVSKTFVVYFNIVRASSHLFHEEVVAASEDDARRIFKERHPDEFHVAREVEEKPAPISTDTKGTTK